jgi:hypothetical protein
VTFALGIMNTKFIAVLSSLSSRVLWVSLGCWLVFVVERFAYNVFDIGLPYHRVPTMFLWLLIVPWICYWIVLFRSSLLAPCRSPIRIASFGLAAMVLAVGFFYGSIAIFWTIASSRGVQFW